ncbi:MAG: hypothetical protein ACI4PM_03540 [Butyricicoccus sp.]
MKTMRLRRLMAAWIVALTLLMTPAFAVEQEQADTTADTQTEQLTEEQEAAAAELEEVDPFSDPRVWAVLVVMFGLADVVYMKQKKKKEHR